MAAAEVAPYVRPPNASAFWNHHQAQGAGGDNLPHNHVQCTFVMLVGLPRTLIHERMAIAWSDFLVKPLKPCVDVCLGLGLDQGSNHAVDDIRVTSWSQLTDAIAHLQPLAALNSVKKDSWSKQTLCFNVMANVERAVSPHRRYDWAIVTRPDILL